MRVCPECGRKTEEMVCAHDGRMTLDESLLEPKDTWTGRVIASKYEIEETIGAGGMGSVHRARHVETGGPVAVKLLHPQAALRPQLIKRFSLEAQNAASLQHVNTIRVIDFGIEDSVPYLVMEFLSGEPLSTTLRREGALPWRRVVRVTQQILASLAEAHGHERRIVHRDIKPANIFLIDQAGQQDFVKVLDFGISRSLEGAGADTRGPIGTPHYMAPEQWTGAEVDGRADLYAVGCLIYEMLAGEPPFDVARDATPARQMTRLADLHLHHDPAPLTRRVGEDVPAALVSLAHGLLHKEPARRPESAVDVIALLAAIETDPSASSGEPWLAATSPRNRAARRSSSAIRMPDTAPEHLVHSELLETMDMADVAAGTPLPGEDGPNPLHTAPYIETGPQLVVTGAAAAEPAPAAPPHAASRVRQLLAVAAVVVLLIVALGVWRWRVAASPETWLATLRSTTASAAERRDATQRLLKERGKRGSQGAFSLRGANLADVRLSDGDLSEADLQEAKLDNSDLRKTDLTGADLRKARMAGADLRGASLRMADLRGANLEGANLTGTGLKGSRYDEVTSWPAGFDYAHSGAIGPKAALGGVDLRGADLRGASLADANLQRGRLKDANLAKASLKGANARGASLANAVLRGADLRDADLRGADLSGADLRGAKLEGVNLAGARYSKDTRFPPGFAHTQSGAVGPKADLAKRDLQGEDLRDVDLRDADLRRSKLQGADLRRARLERARLEGAQYDAQTRWPVGFDADGAGALRAARAAKANAAVSAVAGPTPADPAAPGAADEPHPAGEEATGPAGATAEVRPAAAPKAAAHGTSAPAKRPRTGKPSRQSGGATAPAAVAAAPAAPVKPAPADPPALRRPAAKEVEGRDLAGRNLSGLDLAGFKLQWTRYDSRTRWPPGFDPRTSGAIGPGAKLKGRTLRHMKLGAADLTGADLRKADLRDARLIGARLSNADLRGARLQGADLRGARLLGAKLTGATFNTATKWPEGFQAADHGARLVL